jgi:hypothetical protein
MKVEHNMEMMELKMKMSLLETQQDIINKVTPRNDAPVRKSRNVDIPVHVTYKLTLISVWKKPMTVKICLSKL